MAARPPGEPDVQDDNAPLGQAAGGAPRIPRQPQVAARVAPASGHERADGHRIFLAQRDETVDDLVQRAVTAHRDHQGDVGARGLGGQRRGVATRARLDYLEGEVLPGEDVPKGGPEAPGAAAAGRGVDDEEGGCGYVRPTPPPMARMKSLMDGKRIIGFRRFSAPMVVRDPP